MQLGNCPLIWVQTCKFSIMGRCCQHLLHLWMISRILEYRLVASVGISCFFLNYCFCALWRISLRTVLMLPCKKDKLASYLSKKKKEKKKAMRYNKKQIMLNLMYQHRLHLLLDSDQINVCQIKIFPPYLLLVIISHQWNKPQLVCEQWSCQSQQKLQE